MFDSRSVVTVLKPGEYRVGFRDVADRRPESLRAREAETSLDPVLYHSKLVTSSTIVDWEGGVTLLRRDVVVDILVCLD